MSFFTDAISGKNTAFSGSTPAPATTRGFFNQTVVAPAAPATRQNYGDKSFTKATITTSSGKQYTLDNKQFDWIQSRYKNDVASTYGYDDADQLAKRNGQLSAAALKTYKNTNVDRQLAELGLPSEKNLDKYLEGYSKWHTGGISEVFGDTVSADAWTTIKGLFKQDWAYTDTAEDQQRKAKGLMPTALAAKYTDTELDDDLMARGLPSYSEMAKYTGRYNNYVGIDGFYRNVAGEWTNLRLRGFKNDDNEYMDKDTGEVKTGTQWYADAFFGELDRKGDDGEYVYNGIRGLFKPRTTATEIDLEKDYVSERGKVLAAGAKADSTAEDYARYEAFSFDDFSSKYDGYYEQYYAGASLGDGYTVAKALDEIAMHEDEQREKAFYTITSKHSDSIEDQSGVDDFITRYQNMYPTADTDQMFADMYAHGIDDKWVKETAKQLKQGKTGAEARAINTAYYNARGEDRSAGQANRERTHTSDLSSFEVVSGIERYMTEHGGITPENVTAALAYYDDLNVPRSTLERAKKELVAGYSVQAMDGNMPEFTSISAAINDYTVKNSARTSSERGKDDAASLAAFMKARKEETADTNTVNQAMRIITDNVDEIGDSITPDIMFRVAKNMADRKWAGAGVARRALVDLGFSMDGDFTGNAARWTEGWTGVQKITFLNQLKTEMHTLDDVEDSNNKPVTVSGNAGYNWSGYGQSQRSVDTPSEAPAFRGGGAGHSFGDTHEIGDVEYKPVEVSRKDVLADLIMGLVNPGAAITALAANLGKKKNGIYSTGEALSKAEDLLIDTFTKGDGVPLDVGEYEIVREWMQEQVASGEMTELEGFNAACALGFQDEIEAYDSEAFHAAIYKERYVPQYFEAEKGEQRAFWDEASDEEKAAIASEMWDDLGAEGQAEVFKDYNWKLDPGVYRTAGQTWGQQFLAVLPTVATSIASSAIGTADMIGTWVTGKDELWDVTQRVVEANDEVARFGNVADNINGSAIARIASDATSEMVKMYALGSIGGAIGEGVGSVTGLSSVAAGSAGSAAVQKIAGFAMDFIKASPFVVSAIGNGFEEAKMLGAGNGEATAYALVTGTLEGVLEGLNFDKLWGNVLGQEAFGKMLWDGANIWRNAGVVAKARVINMLVAGLGEATEETASYLAETFWKIHSDWGKDTEWSAEEWAEQAGMGFLTGLLGAGISAGSINEGSILQDYYESNGKIKGSILDYAVAKSWWDNASEADQEKWRNGSVKAKSMSEFANLMMQLDIVDENKVNSAVQQDIEKLSAKWDTKVGNAQKVADGLRGKLAALDATNSNDVAKIANLANQLSAAETALTNAQAERDAAISKATAEGAQRILNATAQRSDIQAALAEHYAAVYLRNESAANARDYDTINTNHARVRQNGDTVDLTVEAQQAIKEGSVATSQQSAVPSVPTPTSVREAAYNRVYKNQEIGKKAAREAGSADVNGLTRVEFAESERQNFQAKTTAKLRRVTLELAGLEVKEGMSAKEVFTEAKKAMTEEAAQKFDLYQKLSKALGLNMVIRDVVTGTSGYVHDGKLYVTLNGKQSVLRVASHELTHYMKDHAGSKYGVLRSHLINEVGGQEAFDQMVMEKAQKYGLDLNSEKGRLEADDEVCAELCERMLENKDALERFVNTDMEAAKTLKARLAKTLVAIKSAIRLIGTSNAKSNSDIIKEQDTIELWYKTLSDAIDSANSEAKAKPAAADMVAEPTAMTEAHPQAPPAETSPDLFMGDEDARREQLRADLHELAKRGTRVNGLSYQEVNDVLDRVIIGDKSNYSKADLAQIRGMLAQLIPEVQAMVNGGESVDVDALNERVSAALDYMLERYSEGSEDYYGLRDLIPNKIALTEAAYNELRSRDMTLRQASNELRNALGGKFVSFVYKKSPGYNNAMSIDELWTRITDAYGEPDGYGNIQEDALALIDYAKERNTRTSFDDLYGSQREDVVNAQVGEFLDAVQSMVDGKAQANTVRFDLDDTGLTEDQYNRVVDYVDNAIAGEGNNKAPYIQFGTVNPELVEGLHRFGVDIKADTPHRLEDNFIRHLRRSHGIEKAKTWGINDSDVRAVPYIVNKYDRAYYRELPNGLKGILYAKDYVDTTYYVEGILEDGSLSGRQMIKVPLHEIPDIYTNDVQKEKALIALPDGASSPKSYVPDVTRDRASNNSIASSLEKSNPSAQHSLDDDYMPLAERYDAGIATDAEVEEMQRNVEEAAAAAGFPAIQYDPVIYDANGDIVPLSERFSPNFAGNRYTIDDDWDELIKKYGAKSQGRGPRARDIQVPERVSEEKRVSDFARSFLESDKAADDMVADFQQRLADGDWMSYTQLTNEQAMDQARSYIAQRQITQAQSEFHDMVTQGQFGTKTNALGLQLLAEAANRGDKAAVLDIATDLQILATEAGQSVQIFSALKELGGVGSAWYMQKVVDRLNTKYSDQIADGKMLKITVDPALMQQLAEAKTTKEVTAAEEAVAKYIGKQIPLTFTDRASNWRYFSMLANPTTHFRNITGNVLMAGLNTAKDAVATGVEKALGVKQGDRAHAILTAKDRSTWSGFAQASFEDQQRNLQGGGKLGFETFVKQNMRMFDSRFLNALAKGSENGKNLFSKNGAMGLLEVEDLAFIRPAYETALMQYMKSQGYTLNEKGVAGKMNAKGEFVEMTKAQQNAAIDWASQQAWKATFRDASSLATMLNKISKENAVSRLLVEGVMPFKKTPINIAKRGIEYSPAGIIMGIAQLTNGVKKGKVTTAQAIDNLSSGITGTALMALGMFLAKAGVIRAGGEDKKKYETYLEDTGDQTYSLKFGDVSINMSAIAPATIPLFMGVALMEALDRNGDSSFDLSTFTDTMAGTLNPFMEMSFMSSLNSALQNYNNEGIGGALGNTLLTAAQNYGSQYLPTLGSKIGQFLDPTRRTTKSDATSPVGGNMDYYWRSLVKKVPGAEATLQPDVDVWGRTDTKDSFGDWALDFANKFILPTNVKITNRDSVDKELIRIVESTGSVDFLPSDGNKYFTVSGQKYTMNARQYTEFSQERGQASYAALKETMRSATYQRATDEEKAAMLEKAIKAAQKQVNTRWKEILGALD